MKVDVHEFEQLRACCRDEAAFEQLQQILQLEFRNSKPETLNSIPQDQIQHLQEDPITQTQLNVERYQALVRVITRIRHSLELDKILTATATEVRQLLAADRVAIFEFDANSNYNEGEFISEDVVSAFDPALRKKVQDHCFGERYFSLYQSGIINIIPDIYKADLKDCHLETLASLQIKSNLVVPLLKREKLWGLLCIHQCQNARNWQAEEIEFVRQIGQHLEIALQQVDYLEQVQAQATQLAIAAERQKAAERQELLYEVVEKIRQSLEVQSIFDTTTAEVRKLLNVERVGVYRFHPDWTGEFVAESVAPGWKPLVGTMTVIRDSYLEETQGGRYRSNESLAVDDIYKAGHQPCHIEILESLQARAYVIVPILLGQKLWGLLAAYQNSGTRHWEDHEVKLLAQIGGQFGVALQQAELLATTQHQAEALQSDLRQTQTQLVQSEKMSSLGQLVAGVAHEINNPVNFIYGNLTYATDYTKDLLELVELYRKVYPEPSIEILDKMEDIELDFLLEDLPKILASMKVGADRIRQLVLSLRNFSRLDEAEMKPVDIHEGIDSTLLILQHRFKSKQDRPSIEIIKKYTDLPKVECYAAQLNQVFMNIISNGIDELETVAKNCPEKRYLAIMITTVLIPSTPQIPQERVRITIHDNGRGIPEALISKVFNPFFTTKPVGKGTGLGLSISYQIVVEKHRGKISCQSHPDEGTEFMIEIPVRQNQGG